MVNLKLIFLAVVGIAYSKSRASRSKAALPVTHECFLVKLLEIIFRLAPIVVLLCSESPVFLLSLKASSFLF